jgi:hypothetical protein
VKFIRILSYIPIMVVCASGIRAQTSADMQRRLGMGPVTEVFQLEPCLTATVSYDKQGQACDVKVEWRQVEGTRREFFFEVEKIAEKLVPESARGRRLGGAGSVIPPMDCCEGWVYGYENVVVTNFGTSDYRGMRLAFRGRKCVVLQPDVVPEVFRRRSNNAMHPTRK